MKTGLHWSLLRLIFAVIGLLLLLVIILVRTIKSGLRMTVSRLLRGVLYIGTSLGRSKVQTKWCEACQEWHQISNDEGEVWEENGRYYYRRDGRVHDVTDFVQSGLFSSNTNNNNNNSSSNENNSNTNNSNPTTSNNNNNNNEDEDDKGKGISSAIPSSTTNNNSSSSSAASNALKKKQKTRTKRR